MKSRLPLSSNRQPTLQNQQLGPQPHIEASGPSLLPGGCAKVMQTSQLARLMAGGLEEHSGKRSPSPPTSAAAWGTPLRKARKKLGRRR
eukprot:302333-Amphidinium_carterae.1